MNNNCTCMETVDMFGRKIDINDEVEFFIDHKPFRGFVNMINRNGMVKINSLNGEYRRKGTNVITIK